MACYFLSFLGSTEGTISLFLGQQSPKDCLLEFQEDNIWENEVEHEAPLLIIMRIPTSRSQVSSHSIRRTPKNPGNPESITSRIPEDPLALMHDPFAAISNTRK